MEKERDFSLGRLVFKIILVIAFVFLLMWLFPMPNLNPVYDRIFADNIDTMKDAAKSYYTVDRLPKEVNASVSMTLSEMLAKKFVLPIADSDGKICDGDASYVQITKTDQPNEYILKANLVCPNKADYVIEYMGCYDLCPAVECICGTECEVPEKEGNKVTPQKTEYITRYQLQRTWYRGTRQYTGASYTEYKHERYENVEEFDRYVCSEGVLVGNTCRITDNSTTTQKAAPIANTTSSSNTTYSCPTGYTASGSGASMTCSRQVTTSNTTYSCPTGYTASGSGASMICSRQVTTSNTTYSCPTGYTASGSGASMTCSRQVTTTTGTTLVYVGTVTSKTALSSTSTYKYVSLGSSTIKDCSVCASYVVYEYKKYKITPTYSTTTQTAAPKANPTSSTTKQKAARIANTTSSTTTQKAAPIANTTSSSNTKYSCPTGYTPSGSGASMTCSRQVSTSSVRIIAAKRIMKTVRVLRDVKWTRNVSEAGYSMVEQRIIPGGTTTVDSGWVLSLPAGYRQTDTKVEYKWSSNKTQAGWTFTGKTQTVKK